MAKFISLRRDEGRFLKRRLCGLLFAIFTLLVLSFVILMSFRGFGTAVTNKALSWWGPDGANVEAAHTSLKSPLTLRAESLNLGLVGQFETAEMRPAIFGFLPGRAWVSHISAQNGDINIYNMGSEKAGESEPDMKEPFDLGKYINVVNVENIALNFAADDASRTLTIDGAKGSVAKGTFDVTMNGAKTQISFNGQADVKSSAFVGGTLTVQGENVQDIAVLLDLGAPHSPPYDVSLTLSQDGPLWRLSDITGTVGDSDITGDITFDPTVSPPHVSANIVSQKLDFDDIAVVFGIPVKAQAGEATNETQQKAAAQFERSDRLIPNVIIDFAMLDKIDGRVIYRAEQIENGLFDMTGLTLDIEVDGRVVRATEAQITFGQGRLTAYATLDGSQDPAVTTAKGTAENLPYDRLSLGQLVRGNLEGDFDIRTTGNGFRAAAANLDGHIAAYSRDTEVAALVVEAAGLDITETLSVFFEDEVDRTFVTADCVAIVLNAQSGRVRLLPAIINTTDSIVIAEGEVLLSEEQMDIALRAEAKDFSFPALMGDIDVEGSLRSPNISVLGADTVLQVTFSAILGALGGPLAALPFIETGDSESSGQCRAALARIAAAN